MRIIEEGAPTVGPLGDADIGKIDRLWTDTT
jgi:hypothetical protein